MYRLMLVRFNRDSGEFDDQEFNRFCREHNIVRIEKEFINSDGNIYYSFFIEYQERREKQGRPDLESMNEVERTQYEKLREWRNDIASSEGIPAYILMYNSQLFDIVKKQPRAIGDFAAHLRLNIKEGAAQLNRVRQGMPFLGYRVFPRLLRIRRENLKRCLRGIYLQESAYVKGEIDSEILYQSTRSRLGFIGFANSLRLQKNIWGKDQQAVPTV